MAHSSSNSIFSSTYFKYSAGVIIWTEDGGDVERPAMVTGYHAIWSCYRWNEYDGAPSTLQQMFEPRWTVSDQSPDAYTVQILNDRGESLTHRGDQWFSLPISWAADFEQLPWGGPSTRPQLPAHAALKGFLPSLSFRTDQALGFYQWLAQFSQANEGHMRRPGRWGGLHLCFNKH